MIRWKAKASLSGTMAGYTRVIGRVTKSMVRALTTGRMDKFTKGILKATSALESAFYTTLTEKDSKACGETGRNTEKVITFSLEAQVTQSSTTRAKSNRKVSCKVMQTQET